MTRHKFAREGIRVKNNHFFEVDSLVWDEQVVVTWMFEFSAKSILGVASNIRREEDGWLSAEIEWSDSQAAEQAKTLLDAKDVQFTVYCSDVIFEKGKSLHVSKARIRAVSLAIYARLWEEQ